MDKLNIFEIAKSITLYPVNSSNVAGIGYNENNKILKVAFKTKNGNNTYIYENVDKDTYNKLIEAQSIGKALNESIIRNKEKYKYTKI